jgi:hypothetical protein
MRLRTSPLLALAALAAGFLAGRRYLRAGVLSPRRRGTASQRIRALAPRSPADTSGWPPENERERRLDEAVEETFPASDPIAVRIE